MLTLRNKTSPSFFITACHFLVARYRLVFSRTKCKTLLLVLLKKWKAFVHFFRERKSDCSAPQTGQRLGLPPGGELCSALHRFPGRLSVAVTVKLYKLAGAECLPCLP